MFSKRNSEILSNNLNSMQKVGKKLSHTALKNMSLNNPSENPDMQFPLNQLNVLPNTMNKFPISKSNNSMQKNVDMDEFLTYINEADKSLQSISILFNNVGGTLIGGTDNLIFPDSMFEVPNSKLSGDEGDEGDEVEYYDANNDNEEVDEEMYIQREIKALLEYKNIDLEDIQNLEKEFKSIKDKEDKYDGVKEIYSNENPQKFLFNIHKYFESESNTEKMAAKEMLKNNLPNYKNILKIIKDGEGNGYLLMLPTSRKEYIDHLSNIDYDLKEISNAITQNRENIKKIDDDLFKYNKKLHEIRKEKERAMNPTKTTNEKGRDFNPEIVSIPTNNNNINNIPNLDLREFKSRSKNQPISFDTVSLPTINNNNINTIPNLDLREFKSKTKNRPNSFETVTIPDNKIPLDEDDDENTIDMKTKKDIKAQIAELSEKLNIEEQKNVLYDLPNAENVIKAMKQYNSASKQNMKTKFMNTLKGYFNLPEEEILAKIPENISDYTKSKNEHNESIQKDKEELMRLKENYKLKEDNNEIKSKFNLVDFIKSKEPIINNMSKFNTQMNRLLVFFKGKIKPNLQFTNKKDISEALNDMDVLNKNFKDVYMDIYNNFQNVFGVKKFANNRKADTFLETWASNFNKISSEIISGLKASSNISSYSLGGMLMMNSVQRNMFKGNKYQL